MKAKNGRLLNDDCGIAKVRDDNNDEVWVVFAKLWPEFQDYGFGGVIGKGSTETEALEDTIKRLLEQKQKSIPIEEALERAIKILKQSTGDHHYESVLPMKLKDENGGHSVDNADVFFIDEEEEFALCVS